MPGSTYSTNLKIELMATGENSGTWGDITNTNLGTALEQAIVGYGNPDFVADANLTISITNSNSSQAARALVLNVTSVFGSLTQTRNLVVPTSQKQYIVQNNTAGGQSIVVKTSAGTGITVPNGRKAHLYVNGTDVIQMFDFVDINGGAIDGTPIGASSASTGAFTSLSATSVTNSGLTATRVPYASTGGLLVDSANMTFNGTRLTVADLADSGLTSGRVVYASTGGALVDSANLTFDGTTLTANALTTTSTVTINGGTANGVAYLNASKVLTTGSALTFDGTGFGVVTSAPTVTIFETASGNNNRLVISQAAGIATYNQTYSSGSTNAQVWQIGSAEQMRLTSTGLGIGTSSPANKLVVSNAGANGFEFDPTNSLMQTYNRSGGAYTAMNLLALSMAFKTGASPATTMLLDSSGNLGLGVTPSAWSTFSTFQVSRGSLAANSSEVDLSHNAYFDGSNWRYIGNGFATNQYQFNGGYAWRIAPSGTAGNAISFTQAMTLDASGNLLVGRTTGTGANIDVYESASTDATIRIGNVQNASVTAIGKQGATTYGATTAGDAFLYADNSLSIMSDNASGVIKFSTGGNTERARITSGGYFKASNAGTYGNDTGSYHELRSSATDGFIANFANTAASPYGIYLDFPSASPDNNTNYFLRCLDSTTTRCYIWSDGDLANHDGVYGTISDARLKQDIVDAGSQWDDLKAIRFRKYRMKTDVEANPNASAMFGVVAQELAEVCPGLVDEHPNMKMVEVTDEEGNVTQTQAPDGTTTMTVKSSILLMKAAKALQEAMARIETLEAKVAQLEGTQP